MTQNLSLSRVTLYKNNLAFAERQGSLNQTEVGRTGMLSLKPPSHCENSTSLICTFSLPGWTDFELRIPEGRRQLVTWCFSCA